MHPSQSVLSLPYLIRQTLLPPGEKAEMSHSNVNQLPPNGVRGGIISTSAPLDKADITETDIRGQAYSPSLKSSWIEPLRQLAGPADQGPVNFRDNEKKRLCA